MKKIRPLFALLLTAILVLSVTACGSSGDSMNETSSKAGSQSATTQDTRPTGTAQVETTGDNMDDGDLEDNGGIIDGIMNDMEDGAQDIKDGMEDMTSGSNGASESEKSSGTAMD